MSNLNTAEEILEEILRDLFPMPHQPTIGVKRTVEDNRRDLKERIQKHTAQTLDKLKVKIDKHFTYQIHNTDEETSKILRAANEDVLNIIEEVSDEQ